VVGPFALTDHRLPAVNPPGWIVNTRSELSLAAWISRAWCRPDPKSWHWPRPAEEAVRKPA